MMEKDVAVLADPTQVHQMVMNLLTNAAHAMKESGGTLDVTITSIVIHRDEILQTRDISPGRYAQILVSDTECGIPGALTDQISGPKPFFAAGYRCSGFGAADYQPALPWWRMRCEILPCGRARPPKIQFSSLRVLCRKSARDQVW